MEWLYFDLVKVTAGYILFDVKYETALTENGKAKVFGSYDEAEFYLSDNDIRGNVRNVVDPAMDNDNA